MMEVSELIQQLRADGERLTSVAASVDLAADVPTCPDWSVADLLHHLGGVHRWATGFVHGAGRQPEDGDLERFVGGWPQDDRLVAWFRDGHAGLVDALRSASPDLDTWTFMDAPSPRVFWARRQAHETAIHRIDGESAVGEVTGVPTPFAVDGIEELLFGFAPRATRSDDVTRRRVLAVQPTDVDRTWSVTFEPNGLTVRPAIEAEPDAWVRGPAAAIYRCLWNRGADEIELTGDEDVPRLWAATIKVTWS